MINKNRLYFLYFSYVPNTACINRAKAYWKILDELGIKAEVAFFLPDSNYSKVTEEYKNITFKYYWDKYYINHRIFKYISFYYYQKKFFKDLNKKDVVYLYGLHDFLKPLIKRDILVYHEKTEHPSVYSLGSTPFSRLDIRKYLEECKKLTGLFVISKSLKDFFIENGVDESKIHIINMTVDSKRFENLIKQGDVEKYIAYCGNVSNSKDGVDELIKSFALVAKKHDDVKLYIIGKLPPITDAPNDIRLLVETLGIKDRVVFTGLVDHNEMPQLLKNAVALALARPNSLQAKHGFPTKLGEYLLTENPVVITDVGDMHLFLKNGESALIAEERNIVDFANKLCWILEHPKEAEEIGRKGKEVALQSFNADIETKKLVDIISRNYADVKRK